MNDRVSWAQKCQGERRGFGLRAGLWRGWAACGCAGSAKGPAPGAPFFERASSSSREQLRVSKHRKDTGRRVTDPKFLVPITRRPCAAIFGYSRPALPRRAGPEKRLFSRTLIRCAALMGGACAGSVPRGKHPRPVVLPDGRPLAELRARMGIRAGVCESLPRRGLGYLRRRRRSPPASPGFETGRRP
jgi:hypothetical protein